MKQRNRTGGIELFLWTEEVRFNEIFAKKRTQL
jgi:hypothetical protein